jgi:hypothetical protein
MLSASRCYLLLALLASALLFLPACGSTGETDRPVRGEITRAEIDSSNVSGSAYDLVLHLRPQWLNKRGGNLLTGQAADIFVYVEGSRMGIAPDALRHISAEAVGRIERLNAREATLRFGTDPGHPEGAILVSTRR